eukprot:g21923.t1
MGKLAQAYDPRLKDSAIVRILRDELGWAWLEGGRATASIKRIERILREALHYTLKVGLGGGSGSCSLEIF